MDADFFSILIIALLLLVSFIALIDSIIQHQAVNKNICDMCGKDIKKFETIGVFDKKIDKPLTLCNDCYQKHKYEDRYERVRY